MNKLALIAYLLLFTRIAALSQGVPTTVADLQKKYVGQRFVVKDLPSQTLSAYHLAAGEMQADISPSFRSIALFIPSQVLVDGSTLTIGGQRRDLAIEGGTKKLGAFPKGLKITLKIDLGGPVSISTISNSLDRFFSTDATAALATIPAYLKPIVPATNGTASLCKACPLWVRQGSWTQKQTGDSSYKQIKLIRGADPRITPEAHEVGGSASVTFAFVVDETGHPAELWLMKAAGYGLDEAAADAIRKSLFHPATYSGTPVAATLREEVSFQTY